MDRNFTFALLIVASVFLAGCSRKNAKPTCPVPDGVKCMSTVDVYERTHGSELVTGDSMAMGATMSSAQPRAQMHVALQDDSLALVSERPATMSMTSSNGSEEPPVRTPARVMRIWIGAWQDDGGGLHMPSHVFTEIEPRRWRIGSDAEPTHDTFRLLDGLGVAAEQDAQTTANANAGGGHPSSSK